MKKPTTWREAFEGPFTYDPEGSCINHKEGRKVLDLRGWGHLTGLSALNLPDDVAMKIQDELGAELADALNKLHSTPPLAPSYEHQQTKTD